MLKGQVKLHIIQLLYLILIKLFLVVERRVRLIFFYLHKIFEFHIFIISFIKGWPFDLYLGMTWKLKVKNEKDLENLKKKRIKNLEFWKSFLSKVMKFLLYKNVLLCVFFLTGSAFSLSIGKQLSALCLARNRKYRVYCGVECEIW